jgi:hypothetical protein
MWRAWYSDGSAILEGPFELQSLHIKFFRRMETLHGRIVPMAYGISGWLLAPNEDKPPPRPIPNSPMLPPPQPVLPPLWWQTKEVAVRTETMKATDVRFWGKADINGRQSDVCF